MVCRMVVLLVVNLVSQLACFLVETRV